MLGIIGAMVEEVGILLDEMEDITTTVIGKRAFHTGSLWGKPVTLVLSKWGKVAAAMTATTLINLFDVKHIIFTGVAGSADKDVKIGDIVVGTKLYQHDMDSTPLYPRHQIPSLGISAIEADIIEDLYCASCGVSRTIKGEIASGDKFFACKEELAEVKQRLPGIACVEMEGAAVAQVCHEFGIPFGIVRIISDNADEVAVENFPKFIEEVASKYSLDIIRNYLHEFNKT